MRVMLLFLKAYQPGLFDQQVTVSGHATKKGTYVQPYQAKRKKRLKDVVEGDMFDEAPQWDFASSKDWVEEERAKKREKTTKRDIELAKKKAEIARRTEIEHPTPKKSATEHLDDIFKKQNKPDAGVPAFVILSKDGIALDFAFGHNLQNHAEHMRDNRSNQEIYETATVRRFSKKEWEQYRALQTAGKAPALAESTGKKPEAETPGDMFAEPADDIIREHARLVKVLRSPSHTDDLKEADEQEQELKEYRKKRKKRKKLNKALLIAPLTALLKAHVKGHTRYLASGKVTTVNSYDNRVAKKAEPDPETEDGLPAGFTVKMESPGYGLENSWVVRDQSGKAFARLDRKGTKEDVIEKARQRIEKEREDKKPPTKKKATGFITFGSDEADEYLENLLESGDNIFFHTSPESGIKGILADSNGRANFGGIFVDNVPGRAYSSQYGYYIYEVRLPKNGNGIADEHDIKTLLREKAANEIIKKEMPELSDTEIERAKKIISASISSYIGGIDGYELIEDDPDDAAWKAQRIRGLIAKKAGYQGVQEEDGVLVFPGKGVSIRLCPVQTDKAINLLSDKTGK